MDTRIPTELAQISQELIALKAVLEQTEHKVGVNTLEDIINRITMPETKQILSKEHNNNNHNLDVLHLGCCTQCGGNRFVDAETPSQQSAGLRWVDMPELPKQDGTYLIELTGENYYTRQEYFASKTNTIWQSGSVCRWLSESASPEAVDDKFEFVEWIRKNDWQPFFDGKWINKNSVGVEYKTTAELYSLFKQSKQ